MSLVRVLNTGNSHFKTDRTLGRRLLHLFSVHRVLITIARRLCDAGFSGGPHVGTQIWLTHGECLRDGEAAELDCAVLGPERLLPVTRTRASICMLTMSRAPNTKLDLHAIVNWTLILVNNHLLNAFRAAAQTNRPPDQLLRHTATMDYRVGSNTS